MKTQLKILMALLILLPITASADYTLDIGLKKECQYVVYGNGMESKIYSTYLAGMISGVTFMIPLKDRTTFGKNADVRTKQLKACQNALNNISADGFEADFMWEVSKLIDKNMSGLK